MKKIILCYLGEDFVLHPDEEKKVLDIIKSQFQNCPIENYVKIPLTSSSKKSKNCAVYTQDFELSQDLDQGLEILLREFFKKITDQTNYLAGCIPSEHSNKKILYLVDIDDLLWIDKKLVICPNDTQKKVYLKKIN